MDQNTIKEAYERNAKAVEMHPYKDVSTGKSTVQIKNGTTCEIEGSGWKLTGDIGKADGGNNAGPGPGVFERAALGSCLAIGYAQQAALMGIPIDNIQVEIETESNAIGRFGFADQPPGFTKIRYKVNIKSEAPKDEVLKLIDRADKYSPRTGRF